MNETQTSTAGIEDKAEVETEEAERETAGDDDMVSEDEAAAMFGQFLRDQADAAEEFARAIAIGNRQQVIERLGRSIENLTFAAGVLARLVEDAFPHPDDED